MPVRMTPKQRAEIKEEAFLKDKKPGGFDSTQQKGNIVKGKLKSQKELKKITSSDEYKKSDYHGKTKMLNVATHLTGGQAKLDKNKNNRIDAQDFKILKAEKAKGRGQGLQDEKMKPGKPMKAALGAIAMGLGAKKMMDKKGSKMPMGMGAAAFLAKKKKEMLGKKRGGEMKKDPSKPVNPFEKRAKKISKVKKILKRVGRLGIAGAALGAAGAGAAMLGRKIGKKLDEAKKKNKKMGGGMMQRPMGYKKGSPENPMKEERFQRTRQAAIAKAIGKENVGDPRKVERPSKKNRVAPVKKTYSVGGSVTVKTKLGRNKPTKMY